MVNTTCGECGRGRTDADIAYSPLQPIMGQPCGWYSGDDAELCGHCMDTILERQR